MKAGLSRLSGHLVYLVQPNKPNKPNRPDRLSVSLRPESLQPTYLSIKGQSSQGDWPFAFWKGLAPPFPVMPVPLLLGASFLKLKRPLYWDTVEHGWAGV